MSPIRPDDRGFTLGHGLFETLLFRDGRPMSWPAHMARLRAGCAVVGLPVPDEAACADAAREALSGLANPAGRAAVRISWSAGPGGRGLDLPAEIRPLLSAVAAPAPESPAPLHLATSAVRRNEGSPVSRTKSLSYLDNVLARREARAAGADEALMLNNRGELACAASANLFWQAGGSVFTPALDCGVLAGTVRALALQACRERGLEVREIAAGPQALAAADAVFLTNSIIGVREVASLDGRPCGGTALAGELHAELFGS